jgi:hypothetical protein
MSPFNSLSKEASRRASDNRRSNGQTAHNEQFAVSAYAEGDVIFAADAVGF